MPSLAINLRLAVWALVLLAGAAGAWWLFAGTRLGVSDRTATYRLIGYWTHAGNHTLEEPFAIVVDSRTGNVLVTDAKAHRVIVFDEDGEFIRTFGADHLENPTGIAAGPDGVVYVSDYDQDQVHTFSETGELLQTLGGPGTGNGQFDGPSGIAVDATGHVYVADFYNKVVNVFAESGEFSRTIGHAGQWRAGHLDYPTDVMVAADGRIAVADAYNYRIQTFSPQGKPTSQWGWHAFHVWPRPAQGAKGFNIPVSYRRKSRGRVHPCCRQW